MKFHRCKVEIKEAEVFEGSILPFIADGERKFLCVTCSCKENGLLINIFIDKIKIADK
jgi:hypothetical protein